MSRIALRQALALALGATMTCGMGTSFAFDMGNMMNPSKWMGGNKNQDRGGDYYGGAPGYGPSPGYYGGPSGRDSGGSNPVGMMPNPMKIFGGNKN